MTTTHHDPASAHAQPPGHITVGVDGSPASGAALGWAFRQAKLTGAYVLAVSTWEFPSTYGTGELIDVDWAGLAQVTLHDAISATANPGSVKVETSVVEGHPALALVQESRTSELLVVGSRGHGGFVGMILGSTSQYVVAHAHCPVLVVHADTVVAT